MFQASTCSKKLQNFWNSEFSQGFWRTDLWSQSRDLETCQQHSTTRLNQWRARSLTTYWFLPFKHTDWTLFTWESGLFDIFLRWFRIPAFIYPWTSFKRRSIFHLIDYINAVRITSPTALRPYETTTVTNGNL